jgi:hypothetical protein
MVSRVACALVVLLALMACSGEKAPAHQAQAGSLGNVVVALCEARAEADPAASEEIFYDRVHARLHDLARATEEVDRAAAARLLEAKEAVESDLAGENSTPDLKRDIEELIGSARRALEVTSGGAPRCSKGER